MVGQFGSHSAAVVSLVIRLSRKSPTRAGLDLIVAEWDFNPLFYDGLGKEGYDFER